MRSPLLNLGFCVVALAGCVSGPEATETVAGAKTVAHRYLSIHPRLASWGGDGKHSGTSTIRFEDDLIVDVSAPLVQFGPLKGKLELEVDSDGYFYQEAWHLTGGTQLGLMIFHRAAEGEPWQPVKCGDAAPAERPRNRHFNFFKTDTITSGWVRIDPSADRVVSDRSSASFRECGIDEEEPLIAAMVFAWADPVDMDHAYDYELHAICHGTNFAKTCPEPEWDGESRIVGNYDPIYASTEVALFRFDPETFDSRQIGEFDFDLGDEHVEDIAIDDDGRLLATTDQGGFYEVDPLTAEGTLLGRLEGTRGSALAYDSHHDELIQCSSTGSTGCWTVDSLGHRESFSSLTTENSEDIGDIALVGDRWFASVGYGSSRIIDSDRYADEQEVFAFQEAISGLAQRDGRLLAFGEEGTILEIDPAAPPDQTPAVVGPETTYRWTGAASTSLVNPKAR